MPPATVSTRWPRKVKVGHATVTVYRMEHEGAKKGVTHVVAWQTPAGRKRRKFSEEKAAMDEARLVAGKLSAGMVDAADITVGDREELAAARELAKDVPILSALREWQDARAL